MRMKAASALFLGLVLTLGPTIADARPGGGFSGGSRGARTYTAPAPTRVAPSAAAPIQRSVTPQTAPSSATSRPLAAPAPAPLAQPGFAQRNPFVTGLLGGLVGAGLFGMLSGHGFGWGDVGGGGGGGGLGVLLQLLLIGGAIWFAVSMLRRRSTAAPAMAYPEPLPQTSAQPGYSYVPNSGPAPLAFPGSGGSAAVAPADEIGLTNADFDAFEHALGAIQQAWTAGDIVALRRLVTPEMLSYFSEQLATNVSKGVTNTVQDVKLEQGDLSEAWREADIEYATTALAFTLIDFTTADDGRVVAGSKTERQRVTELWTFMRQADGGRWLLSAIQQTA